MRILYILRASGHFSYHAPVMRALARQGHEVELLLDDEQNSLFSRDVAQSFVEETPGVSEVRPFIRRRGPWRRPLFLCRELRSYGSYCRRKGQSDFYRHRWSTYLPRPLQPLASSKPGRALLGSRMADGLLAAADRLTPPFGPILDWLRQNRPDVVIAEPLNRRACEEVEYVKAAKRLGIPTVVLVQSWDNLTTKGLYHEIPDLVLAWNERHRQEAITLHGVRPEQIVLVGSPFFDKWFDGARLDEPRERLCERVGLDPARPIVVYLGSSSNIAKDETWLVRELCAALARHPEHALRAVQMLVRPHPANTKHYEALSEPNMWVWPRGGALPDAETSLRDFRNTLVHAAATVGINTTGMIDAVIVDRPCITVTTEQYQKTQLEAVHFQHLLEADVLEVTRSTDECVQRIGAICGGQDTRAAARRAFVREFVRPHGLHVPAADVAAQAIVMAGQRKVQAEIAGELRSLVAARANPG